MYGLPQAGIIAQELLEKQLAEYGYHQSKIINGFWKHKTRLICFCLMVDDFAVKYVNQEDAEHINAIKRGMLYGTVMISAIFLMTTFSCSRESYNTCRVTCCKKTNPSAHPVAVWESNLGRGWLVRIPCRFLFFLFSTR